MNTTLRQIRDVSPCNSGWKKLLSHLGKTQADDVPLSIVTILDINGLDAALWCLHGVKSRDKEIRLFGVWCARQVQHLMTDPRSIAALDVAERFAYGLATSEELTAAWDAAWDAAGNAAWAKSGDSAWAASRAAAWAAAGDSAWAASRAAARDAAWDSARAGAGDAAGDSAWAAARAAARAAQEAHLRKICAALEAT